MDLTLDSFIGKIINNLKDKNFSEEKINGIREKLRKKYYSLFHTEVNDCKDINEDYTEDYYLDSMNNEIVNVKEDNSNIPLIDLSIFQKEDEYDNPIKREKRIKNWVKHYEDLYEKTGVRIFNPEEEDDVNERGEFGRTMLHQAIIDDDEERVRELLEEGADWTITDNSAVTPLMQAALDNNVKIIKILKEYGVKK